MLNKVEVWKVSLKHQRYVGCAADIMVKATNGTRAEKKALSLAPKLDDFVGVGKSGIYVSELKFNGYLYL